MQRENDCRARKIFRPFRRLSRVALDTPRFFLARIRSRLFLTWYYDCSCIDVVAIKDRKYSRSYSKTSAGSTAVPSENIRHLSENVMFLPSVPGPGVLNRDTDTRHGIMYGGGGGGSACWAVGC